MPDSKVLIIDDNEDILFAAKLLLKPYTCMAHTEKDPNNIPSLMKNGNYDVIFLDMNFTKDITSGEEGFFWLKEILSADSAAVVILITAYGDVETAVRAIKEGATDFVLKPWQNEKFIATFSSAVKLRESKIQLKNLLDKQKQLNFDKSQSFHELIGTSDAIKEVFSTIEKVASTDANILILGENGTGKELVAHALHKRSKRANEVFVSVDMGAVSAGLFESELFGHVKGAFTDAKEDRAGRFETASGGTMFLDEIGNISLEQQARLLSVLQNRKVTRVGSNSAKEIDIRLICATNKPIYQMVTENSFRQDLLYRINTVEIKIPALRDRKTDIPLLTHYFLSLYKKKYDKESLTINPATISKLENYTWPGNVRELQHALERSVILCDTGVLNPSDFYFSKYESKEDIFLENFNLEEVEKTIIRKILVKHDGNVTKAARELGLTRTSLYRRMEKFGL